MIDLVLLFIFFASIGGAAFFFSGKIPALVSIPEHVLDESFANRPPSIIVLRDRMRAVFVWARVEGAAVSGLEKGLRRVRIWLLRGDAFVSWVLARLQERSRVLSEHKPRYLRGLKDWKRNEKHIGSVLDTSPPTVSSLKNLDSVQKLFHSKNESHTE